MRNFDSTYFLLTLVFCLSANAIPNASQMTDQRSDSGVFGPPYSVQLEAVAKLKDQYPELLEIMDYGRSVQGRTLRMIVIKNKVHTSDPRQTILITGTVHGDEYLHVEDQLPKLILASIKENPTSSLGAFFKMGGAILVVPIVNPDGYENRTRTNGNGVDVNRDWRVKTTNLDPFKEPESRCLAEKLDELSNGPLRLKYVLAVDYHCCNGAILYPWSHTADPVSEKDKAQFLTIADLARKHLQIETGTTGEILGYHPSGTLKDYLYDHYGTLSFTFEGRHLVENTHIKNHINWWQSIATYINKAPHTPFFTFFLNLRKSFKVFAE